MVLPPFPCLSIGGRRGLALVSTSSRPSLTSTINSLALPSARGYVFQNSLATKVSHRYCHVGASSGGVDGAATTVQQLGKKPPIILLDIDGVINILGTAETGYPSTKRAWVPFPLKAPYAFPFRWAPVLIDTLNDWSASGKAEIRWLTTWDN
jgi:hypothetical protein